MLFTATLLAVRNQRVLTAWTTRQEDNQRRAAKGLPPKPANGAARPSLASPRRHNQHHAHRTTPLDHHSQQQAAACPEPGHPGTKHHHANTRTQTARVHGGMSDPNVKTGLTKT